MDVGVVKEGCVHVASLSGEIELGEEIKIAKVLQPLVADPHSKLAIDLSGLKQISSLGLSELINVVTRSRLTKSRVVMFGPSSFVTSVFAATRLNNWFDIVADLPAARKTLGEPS